MKTSEERAMMADVASLAHIPRGGGLRRSNMDAAWGLAQGDMWAGQIHFTAYVLSLRSAIGADALARYIKYWSARDAEEALIIPWTAGSNARRRAAENQQMRYQAICRASLPAMEGYSRLLRGVMGWQTDWQERCMGVPDYPPEMLTADCPPDLAVAKIIPGAIIEREQPGLPHECASAQLRNYVRHLHDEGAAIVESHGLDSAECQDNFARADAATAARWLVEHMLYEVGCGAWPEAVVSQPLEPTLATSHKNC
ncbi:MAG TPA: hypothetical protein VLF71_02205 [Candidatus Saccharimonadales bacterium]|nr:hypothetical protein [Candidatus Saccharimonadales bacterium]